MSFRNRGCRAAAIVFLEMVRRKKDYLCIATALADMTKNTMPLADNTTLFTVHELRSFYDGAGMLSC